MHFQYFSQSVGQSWVIQTTLYLCLFCLISVAYCIFIEIRTKRCKNTLPKTEQIFYLRNGTFQVRTKLFKSEQNFMSSHNCNEIRNKILLKTVQKLLLSEQNFSNQNKTLSSHNCNEIRNKIFTFGTKLFKSKQNFSNQNKTFQIKTKLFISKQNFMS